MFSTLTQLIAALFAGLSSTDSLTPKMRVDGLNVPLRVTSTRDAGSGSLRDAIEQANLSGQSSVIQFDLSETDPGYNPMTKSWRITPVSDLPVVTVPVLIDAFTQRGSCPNSNPVHESINGAVKIELNGPGITAANPLDGRRGLVLAVGSDESVVKGLAVINFPVGIEIVSSKSCVRGMFLGIGVDGSTPELNGISVLVARSADGTCIGTDLPEDRNLIAGVGYQVVQEPVESGAITIQGDNTVIQGTIVGLTSTGNALPVTEQPVAGVVVTENTGTVIGGPAPASTVVIATFGTNVVAQNTGTLSVINVLIGTDNTGISIPTSNFGGGGLGVLLNFRGNRVARALDEPLSKISIVDSVIAGQTKSGIVLGQTGEPVSLVSIVNTKVGTDRTGLVPLPNAEHGLDVVNAVDTFVSGCTFNHNQQHGVHLTNSVRTIIEKSDASNNGLDGFNFLLTGVHDSAASENDELITIMGDMKTDCYCDGDDSDGCLCSQYSYGRNNICC